ncbi:MAG: hypothetical protein KGI89_13475, partial [Euryarchaeota archaeon]|nr:hypothetical protein [Euryarchaeota archaeon]
GFTLTHGADVRPSTPSHLVAAVQGAHSLPREGTSSGGGRSPAAPSVSPCGFPQCVLLQLGTSASVGGFYPTTTFNTGTVGGADQVFFRICDFAGDHWANVTIEDLNSSSDGLPTRVFYHSVPLVFSLGSGCPGGTAFDSTIAPQLFYTLPRSLVQGGTWLFNVTASTSSWSMNELNFHVDTYFVQLTPDQLDHLPGDRATVFYQVLSYVTQGPESGSLAFRANGLYVNGSRPYAVTALPPLTPPVSAAQGEISFLIPQDAQRGQWAYVNLWANLTASGRTGMETGRLTFSIAQVIAPEVCASTTTDGGPIPCPSPLSFPQGSELVVREDAVMGALSGTVLGAIPGATFSLQLYASGVPVSAPPSFPTSVTADASGTAREVLDTTVLRVSSLTISVTVTDPQNPSLTNRSTLNITLLGNSSQVAVVISLNSTQYYGGDTLGGTFALVLPGGGGGTPPYWTAYAYQVYFFAGSTVCPMLPTGALEAQGNLSGGSGNVPPYTLALSMNGIVELIIFAHNGTSASSLGIFSMACALVSPPQILVNPSEVNYLPGDTITVGITGQGSVLVRGNPSYYANVVGFASVSGHTPCSGSTMQVLYGGAVSGTTFSFTVPKNGASICYEVSVSAETSSGLVSGEDVELDEVNGFSLTASVSSPSQYTDGSFQPGQTIDLAYALTALGSSSLPRAVTLLVQLGVEPATRTQQASTSGTFSVGIPSNQGGGLLLISVEAEVADPNSPGGVQYVSTITGVMVHPNPSWLEQELSPGGGFTNGDLLVVVVILAIAAIGLLLWWRGRWERPSKHFRESHGTKGEAHPMHPEPVEPGPPLSAPVDEVAPAPFGDAGPSSPPAVPGGRLRPEPPPEPPAVTPGPPTSSEY